MFRRRSAPRRRFARNQNMRVWTAVANSTAVLGPQQEFILADAAAFATTAGNSKHIGTLVRIRGHITFTNVTAGSLPFSYGISLADVNEVTQSPTSSNYGRDEDVLVWEAERVAHGSSIGGDPCYIPIDVKAKRRLDVEAQVLLTIQGPVTPALDVAFSMRCLFLVP